MLGVALSLCALYHVTSLFFSFEDDNNNSDLEVDDKEILSLLR